MEKFGDTINILAINLEYDTYKWLVCVNNLVDSKRSISKWQSNFVENMQDHINFVFGDRDNGRVYDFDILTDEQLEEILFIIGV